MQFNNAEQAKTRVNITLDVVTDEAASKKELPLKLLLLGDYSRGRSSLPLRKRKRYKINKTNIDAVLEQCAPGMKLMVNNRINAEQESLSVKLKFKHRQDFEPLNIIQQVPELTRLMAMRTILKDLKANLMDNHELKRILNTIIIQPAARLQLQAELSGLIPSAEQGSKCD